MLEAVVNFNDFFSEMILLGYDRENRVMKFVFFSHSIASYGYRIYPAIRRGFCPSRLISNN